MNRYGMSWTDDAKSSNSGFDRSGLPMSGIKDTQACSMKKFSETIVCMLLL
jgi:hypothetical protein